MPAYSTETEISNMALALIGEYRIASFIEDSAPARLCSEFFYITRDAMLRSHRWNFAIKRQALVELDEKPLFTFAKQFVLPVDCMRVLEMNNTEVEWAPGDRWAIEGKRFLCNDEEVNLLYVRKEEDPSLWDPMFIEALSIKLASKIAPGLKGDTSRVGELVSLYEQVVVPLAKRTDANESRKQNRRIPWRSISTDLRRGGSSRMYSGGSAGAAVSGSTGATGATGSTGATGPSGFSWVSPPAASGDPGGDNQVAQDSDYFYWWNGSEWRRIIGFSF